MLKAIHGGDFFKAIGEDFSRLASHDDVVSADVLDAWYDPAPEIVEAIRGNLEWLIKTSPPTHAEGLRETISRVRSIPSDHLVLGSGTSSLMFQAFPMLVKPGQKALLLDPTYGEYRHLLTHVVPTEIHTLDLELEDGFAVRIERLIEAARQVDFVVLVNPNSPTGGLIPHADMRRLLESIPATTRVWVDETYIDFVPGQTVEGLVPEFPNLVVSKSMSKFYAISGLRLGYLAIEPSLAIELDRLSPPWNIGMLAQLAGIKALEAGDYYRQRAEETFRLREGLALEMVELGYMVAPSVANYVLAQVPVGATASEIVARAAEQKVFLRNCSSLSPRFGEDYIRVAVKGADVLPRILTALGKTGR